MKPAISKLISVSFAVMMILAVVGPVQADTSTGNASGIFDNDGNLLPGVTDLGEQAIPNADWMNISIGSIDIVPTGHEYVSADGKTVFVPSTSTLIAMATNPDASGLSDTVGQLSGVDSTSVDAILVGSIVGTLSGNESAKALLDSKSITSLFMSSSFSDLYKNYVSGNLFADTVNSGDTDVFSLLGKDTWQIFLNLIKTDIKDKQISSLYLAYASCSDSPTGCANNICKLAPQEASCAAAAAAADAADTVYVTAPSCPAATVTRGTVFLNINKIAPNYPLVVGQDPNKRGADVFVSASIQPTVYTYYTQVPVYGTSKVCPGDKGSCKASTMITITTLIRMDCISHTVYYKEPIIGVKATASLTQTSQDWITNGLSAYYYGAYVKKSGFALVPGLANATGSCNGSKVCSASATINRIQFQDPGYYGLSLSVTTSGTPVTAGRTLTGAGSLSVAFISVRLTSGN